MPLRLPPQPGEVLDRGRRFTFTWNGRRHAAFAGDTIASALTAAGVRVFSRSLKYHRPRGLLTADFDDPGCLVEVDGEPNVRGAHRLVEPGMVVRAQNVWPSLGVDVKAANQLLGPVLSAGFYYKTFMAPRRLWPLYERVLRQFAPGGRVPTAVPAARYDHRFAHPDVLVAGGGPAGMAAAVTAAEAGASVMLVDQQHALGGHLRGGGPAERAALADLERAVAASARIEVLTDAAVTGVYDDGWVAVLHRAAPDGVTERLVKARAKHLVLAPGLIERPLVFAGNDLPGVLLSTAVRRLIGRYAVRPGHRAVVLSANDEGHAAAEDLARVGVAVVRVLDVRAGEQLVRATGRGRVQCVECADGGRVEVDLLVTATGWTAPTALLTMAGGRAGFDDRCARFVPLTLPDHVSATGGLVGDGSPAALVAHGRAIGREAARRAAHRAVELVAGSPHAVVPRPPASRPEPVPALSPAPHPGLFLGPTPGIVDFAEDVSSTDLASAVAEGYDRLELAKRYTTATMGPTQGRLEAVNTIAAVAGAAGRGIAETGTTTGRPPYHPVSLGALAGRTRTPVRRSPMQDWHEAHGATPLLAGAWVRPDHYGDPAAEVRTVRSRVGIIDVTPLGKIDLRGPDVAELLELLYVNRWRGLAVGSVRYGVMCGEDGVVVDDGVTGRLATEHYLMTTTSSGAAAACERVEYWLQVERPHLKVHALGVTDAYASINVAGPRSRALVARLTDVDVSPTAFPYLHVRTGRVAGVADCVLWRIGFTGELSYELHVPACYGPHVWQALLAAGRDLGVAPFGVEAQRILRLEKGHLIVGQDTDGLTSAHAAGLTGLVKPDKPDFAGKPELSPPRPDDELRLVALQTLDPHLVPAESALLLDGSRIVGRITSSRHSPTLGRSVCLGLLARPFAVPDTVVTARLPDRRDAPVRVLPQLAQVDPEGVRLRA